jgi:hypothetical protein
MRKKKMWRKKRKRIEMKKRMVNEENMRRDRKK